MRAHSQNRGQISVDCADCNSGPAISSATLTKGPNIICHTFLTSYFKSHMSAIRSIYATFPVEHERAVGRYGPAISKSRRRGIRTLRRPGSRSVSRERSRFGSECRIWPPSGDIDHFKAAREKRTVTVTVSRHHRLVVSDIPLLASGSVTDLAPRVFVARLLTTGGTVSSYFLVIS